LGSRLQTDGNRFNSTNLLFGVWRQQKIRCKCLHAKLKQAPWQEPHSPSQKKHSCKLCGWTFVAPNSAASCARFPLLYAGCARTLWHCLHGAQWWVNDHQLCAIIRTRQLCNLHVNRVNQTQQISLPLDLFLVRQQQCFGPVNCQLFRKSLSAEALSPRLKVKMIYFKPIRFTDLRFAIELWGVTKLRGKN
jgi:hypothetical protein